MAQDLAKISERIRNIASIGEGQALLVDLLNGPVKAYFDTNNFEKDELEQKIEEYLQQLRQEYRQTQKYLTQAFQDVIQMVNGLQDLPEEKLPEQLENLGITENAKQVYKILKKINAGRGEDARKLENLLKQVHYNQLINFDYKFAITTADSMIQGNGKTMINLKMDLLNQRNEKESVYAELTLQQFYTLFHELKRAHSLMEVV